MLTVRTLIIDNYDSFTYNICQYVAELSGIAPVVLKNDELPWADVGHQQYGAIIVSPGPGRPDLYADFGISTDAILQEEVPVLGVCLGHQGIGNLFGAKVIHAPEAMHGRLSMITHSGEDIFRNIQSPLKVVRYHSLMISAESLPEELICQARTDDGIIMAIRHRDRPIWGVQFHPESISTEHGKLMIRNFLYLASEERPLPMLPFSSILPVQTAIAQGYST